MFLSLVFLWGGAAVAATVDEDISTWRGLLAGADWQEVDAFAARNPEWPLMERIYLRAERSIPSDADPAQVAAFFARHSPQTGTGVLRLGDGDVVRDAWRNFALTQAQTEEILETYDAQVAGDHAARVDMLLWRGRLNDAQALLPLLGERDRLEAELRIALARDEDGAIERSLDRAATMRTGGIAYEQFAALRRADRDEEALGTLLGASINAQGLGRPSAWANARRQIARAQMRAGEARMAYYVAATHHLEGGGAWADLEFLAGFIALRLLFEPEKAKQHFERLRDGVRTPISLGRAWYWIGRAEEAMGGDATVAYREGAKHQTSFYGLLSAEKLGLPLDPSLAGTRAEWRGADFTTTTLFQAGVILHEAGARDLAEWFITKLARDLDAAALTQLATWAEDAGAPHLAVRFGKQAAARGIVVPTAYFPLHPMMTREVPVEMALALAIARRESEFDPVVQSSAGAIGLMQLMPATARQVAGQLNLSYRQSQLRNERFNVTLGTAYLEDLEEIFGPSVVQIAAGYNAGPSRPLRWMDAYGDPRLGEVDVIDWIEFIPFRETRNYVMRVTESIMVYRARLGQAGTAPLEFTQMLIGEKPIIRPRVRPSDLVPLPETVQDAALPAVREGE
ncbi:lytic transglycosylase domain-containing protein [Nereida sp. MMG025]|uniref:lytic transglycosylase domain-containing protein n=1 Tax=Nereida sp. MMG025 TaxID=2909981 RepID=UPI001F29E1CB|nr:lytic transglycosylase domain-containing protein [Nereida sp. MMG025]MCF6444887.1 lytic transglycosylase domain-containing protein [Nereida sp. MMG025]